MRPVSPASPNSPLPRTSDSMRLTHLDDAGRPRMVDVSTKPTTLRVARATALITVSEELRARLLDGTLPKGDALTTARLAGILGAKRTPDLIPLCHPLRLDEIVVDVCIRDEGVRITTQATARDVTGVEMEALTAAAIAALTVYDMIKAVDRGAVIGDLRVTYKAGGKSGAWSAPGESA